MKNGVSAFALQLSLVAVALTACGGTSSHVQSVTVLSVATTATPSTIPMGETATCLGTVSYSNSTSDHAVTYTATKGTITSSGVYTPSAVGAGSCTATSTTDTTKSNTATITVNAPVPTASLTCAPTSVTLGSSVSCTIATTNATTVTASSTDGSWTGSVTTNGTVSVTPTSTTGSVTYSITAKGSGGSITASSGVITVTGGQIQLTSIVPAAQWVVGEGGYVPFTFYGANFVNGETIVTTPDANIEYGQSRFVNSGELIVYFGIDQIHEGSGWRSAKVCQSDGTGCSKAIPFGMYDQNECASATSGETFCLNPQETVAGQNLYNGQPLNGYVDKFTSTGAPDGKFYVGAPSCCITLEPTTNIIQLDGRLYDQNGSQADVPSPLGYSSQPDAANAAAGGFTCLIEPSATNDLSCVNITGGGSSQPTVMSVNVGTNPQSLAMGTVVGKTYAFVLTGGSAPALWSVDVTDGMTNITSQPVTGVTANLPGGSAITVFDSLGVGVITSFGDNLAIPFSETTLKPMGNAITLPGVPVSATASTANGVVIIGNADQANAGGTFTEVDPVAGTATAVPSVEAPVMPVGVVSAATGKGFSVCPQDGVSPCSQYTLP